MREIGILTIPTGESGGDSTSVPLYKEGDERSCKLRMSDGRILDRRTFRTLRDRRGAILHARDLSQVCKALGVQATESGIVAVDR